ncbi:hypothetical protein ACKKBF_B40055 [Auxenochlorella protothecoides x Auxenochlorella symbiontica]
MKMDPASRADTAARTTRMGQTMAAGAVYQPLCGAFQARGTQHEFKATAPEVSPDDGTRGETGSLVVAVPWLPCARAMECILPAQVLFLACKCSRP